MGDDTLKRPVLHELIFGDLPQIKPLAKVLVRCPQCLNQTQVRLVGADGSHECLNCHALFTIQAQEDRK